MDSDQTGDVLRCARCSYSWAPRKGKIPQRCPRCRSVKWNMPYLNLVCKRCGYEWSSHNGTPKRCPKCGTHQWDVAPKSYTCKRCGNTWVAKGTALPKRCPACSCREWDKEPGEGGVYVPIRHVSNVDEETLNLIVEKYDEGFGCMSIAINLHIPYSVVIDAVMDAHKGIEINV